LQFFGVERRGDGRMVAIVRAKIVPCVWSVEIDHEYHLRTVDGAVEWSNWPNLRPDKSIWVPTLSLLVREVAHEPELLISAACPNPEEALRGVRKALQLPVITHRLLDEVMGENYGYFGYAVHNLAQFEILCAAFYGWPCGVSPAGRLPGGAAGTGCDVRKS